MPQVCLGRISLFPYSYRAIELLILPTWAKVLTIVLAKNGTDSIYLFIYFAIILIHSLAGKPQQLLLYSGPNSKHNLLCRKMCKIVKYIYYVYLLIFCYPIGSNENSKLSISFPDLLSANEKGMVLYLISLDICHVQKTGID